MHLVGYLYEAHEHIRRTAAVYNTPVNKRAETVNEIYRGRGIKHRHKTGKIYSFQERTWLSVIKIAGNSMRNCWQSRFRTAVLNGHTYSSVMIRNLVYFNLVHPSSNMGYKSHALKHILIVLQIFL
jgi:hypothetical protein